jgi:hypothetical protein
LDTAITHHAHHAKDPKASGRKSQKTSPRGQNTSIHRKPITKITNLARKSHPTTPPIINDSDGRLLHPLLLGLVLPLLDDQVLALNTLVDVLDIVWKKVSYEANPP